jgi:nucleoside-diphosphate-sugar epimerase
MINLEGKSCVVTGASSMIGKQTCNILKDRGADVFEVYHEDFNLTRRLDAQDLFLDVDCEYVFHLAGYNGGIKFNADYPADIFYNTVSMGMNVLNSVVNFGHKVKKVLFILPSCALCPSDSGVLHDFDLYKGQPHPSVECHGLAKRTVEAYGRQIEKQHGIKFISAIANNSFGPGDHFCEEKGKVISGMIKRFVAAKESGDSEVVCWGTGQPLREFVYCKDVANGLVQLMETYDRTNPVIITSDYEISIKDLAHTIAKAVGYTGDIVFDTTKKDGQMRKKLDSSTTREFLPNLEITKFDKAIKETVEWYLENK